MRHLRTCSFLAFTFLVLWIPVVARSQGTADDYERADKLRQRTPNKVFKSEIKPNWFAENTRFWYRNDLPDGAKEFIVVDVNEGKRTSAFDHQRLATSLGDVLKAEVKPSLLPLDQIQFAEDGKSLLFRAKDKGWSCNLETYEVKEAEVSEPEKKEREDRRRRRRGEAAPRRDSPDGKWEAFVKDHKLFVRDKASSEEFALGDEGTEDDVYQERFYWSPDSTKLVAIRRKRGDVRKVYLIESSPKDQLQPKLQSYDYLKPGDDIPLSKPQLFDVVDRTHIPVSDQLFPNPWRISEVRWQKDSQRFTFLYNQRGHQLLRIVAVDGQTGEAGTILNEESKTFIDYAYKQFAHHVASSNELIWMSERDGWNHLYLYDGISGSVKNQITRGPWVVRGVDRVDEEKREIWFRASGVYPEQDPYFIHYCRVKFDGTGFLVLTAGNGTHRLQPSPDRKFFVDTYSRVDMPPVHELRRSEDGLLVCKLERADISALLATGWRKPERFVAKGRDGKTDIYGVIWRPTNFDPARKYPVIEDIYAGPHGSFVPKSFSAYSKRMSLAELGFVVVKIDGMGTSNRSKVFHDVCWKNVGDSGFPDRILWIKAVANKYPYVDITRVGIYGGSAGGQSSTRALLAHGDFYHVAVSDCGCHDNRMDKIWWNELWMGWPLGDHYKEQSNVTQAHRLEGKLLLIVGELDRNVDPASTMQVVDALIKADKDFDMLVVPGGGHGIAESTYGTRRRRDFFVRHLLGAEPRRQTEDNTAE
jgi:dipeptidyl aminopeptidase/acylaminoacyl peptidase